jgi:hypothetical protein
MATDKLDLSTLREDGDTLELDDGRVLRLKIEIDQDTSINDSPDCYGKINDEVLRRNEMGYYARPKNFTGNAEQLRYGNYGPWWWEPPVDVKRTDPNFKALRDNVRELLAFGFKSVILELCQDNDCYGNYIVRHVASLWGIDSLDNGYIHEVVRELASELEVV